MILMKLLLAVVLLLVSCAQPVEEPTSGILSGDSNPEIEVPDEVTFDDVDINSDGVINISDLVIVSRFIGQTKPVDSAPEGGRFVYVYLQMSSRDPWCFFNHVRNGKVEKIYNKHDYLPSKLPFLVDVAVRLTVEDNHPNGGGAIVTGIKTKGIQVKACGNHMLSSDKKKSILEKVTVERKLTAFNTTGHLPKAPSGESYSFAPYTAKDFSDDPFGDGRNFLVSPENSASGKIYVAYDESGARGKITITGVADLMPISEISTPFDSATWQQKYYPTQSHKAQWQFSCPPNSFSKTINEDGSTTVKPTCSSWNFIEIAKNWGHLWDKSIQVGEPSKHIAGRSDSIITSMSINIPNSPFAFSNWESRLNSSDGAKQHKEYSSDQVRAKYFPEDID